MTESTAHDNTRDVVRKEILAALAAFQWDMPLVGKAKDAGKETQSWHFKYAGLDDILETARTHLKAHKLGYFFDIIDDDGSTAIVVCTAFHAPSGQSITSCVRAIYGKQDPQARGIVETYCKRRAFCNAFGIVSTKEDDENELAKTTGYDGSHRHPHEYDTPKAQPVALLSDAQHKRLEARITELGLDRDRVKGWVNKVWNIDHLTELPAAYYARLDAKLDEWASMAISEPQYSALNELAEQKGIDFPIWLNAAFGMDAETPILARDYPAIKKALKNQAPWENSRPQS